MMTPEEIQRTIEGMLAVQKELQQGQISIQENQIRDREQIEQMLAVHRELQESQLRQQEESQRQREDLNLLGERITQLIEVSERHERRIEQLIGYSITDESSRLDLQQQMNDLKRRVQQLENQDK